MFYHPQFIFLNNNMYFINILLIEKPLTFWKNHAFYVFRLLVCVLGRKQEHPFIAAVEFFPFLCCFSSGVSFFLLFHIFFLYILVPFCVSVFQWECFTLERARVNLKMSTWVRSLFIFRYMRKWIVQKEVQF